MEHEWMNVVILLCPITRRVFVAFDYSSHPPNAKDPPGQWGDSAKGRILYRKSAPCARGHVLRSDVLGGRFARTHRPANTGAIDPWMGPCGGVSKCIH